uniref:Serpin domain-containing protein n=1 Tax=Varanus komodoensis TaxID=61221 RepID=A0A8D2INS1_VARKO
MTEENGFFVDEQTMFLWQTTIAHLRLTMRRNLHCQVVQLPYKGGPSALFILPDNGKIKQVEDALGKDVLLKWTNSLRVEILLQLPRFSMSGTDLFGITGISNLKVSKVSLHKAFPAVRESGTEAAAASVLGIVPESLPVNMAFNKPFILLIAAPNSTILFMGKTVNPVKK